MRFNISLLKLSPDVAQSKIIYNDPRIDFQNCEINLNI